jgi:hypothetical protein
MKLPIALLLILLASCAAINLSKEAPSTPVSRDINIRVTQVDAHINEWEVVAFIDQSDSTRALAVTYTGEIGFSSHTVTCMAIWENKRTGDYMCIAPWIDVFYMIRRSNILDLTIKYVDKDSCGLQ